MMSTDGNGDGTIARTLYPETQDLRTWLAASRERFRHLLVNCERSRSIVPCSAWMSGRGAGKHSSAHTSAESDTIHLDQTGGALW
jgi:hypothetical protein